MKKRIFLKFLANRRREELEGWASRAIGPRLDGLLEAASEARIKLAYSHPRPPRVSVPSISRRSLLLCALTGVEEGPALESLREALVAEPGALEEHEVEPTTPREYQKSWPDKELSPGAILLTLFKSKAGLPREELLRRWHEEHTPLALSIHPLWRYERNVVLRTIRGEPWLGIVEEHARHRADLVRPWRFFGSPLRMLPNMLRVGLHARTFLELGTVENHLLRELWVRS